MTTADNNTHPMQALLDQQLSCRPLKSGQVVPGVIVDVSPSGLVVDVGAKCEGFVPRDDLQRLPADERDALATGSKVFVYVLRPGDAGEEVVLSLSRAQSARDWRSAQQAMESGEALKRKVVDANRGGVIVRFGTLRGFVPASQLDPSRTPDAQSGSTNTNSPWRALVDELLELKIIEVDHERNRLILSERAATSGLRQQEREQLLAQMSEGDVLKGQVTSVVDFGAFVDVGGIDGLVHISEMSWHRIGHASEVVKAGDSVDVSVLRVDKQRGRIALSIKRLLPDPWTTLAERYEQGQLVEGVVTRLTDWGAFAELVGDEAIEGLIHVSELAIDPVVHPRDVVSPGQRLVLRVVEVNPERRRLGLSLKQVAQGELVDADWRSSVPDDDTEPETAMSAALSGAMDVEDLSDQAQADVEAGEHQS